jgi:hypothetical protein
LWMRGQTVLFVSFLFKKMKSRGRGSDGYKKGIFTHLWGMIQIGVEGNVHLVVGA